VLAPGIGGEANRLQPSGPESVLPRLAMLALPESRSSPLTKSKKKTHRIEQDETP
jgi:hypothetical protein